MPTAETLGLGHTTAATNGARKIAPLANGSSSAPSSKLREWDAGLLDLELVRQNIVPQRIDISPEQALNTDLILSPAKPSKPLEKGSFSGTQKVVSAIYSRGDQSFGSYFDVAGFEPNSAIPQTHAMRRDLFNFQKKGSDKYPPHLAIIPKKWQNSLTEIFNWMRLLDTSSLLVQVIPDCVEDFIHSDPSSDTLAGLTKRNQQLRAQKKDVMAEPNIGDRNDWYTDRLFAQQQLTGVNPATIERASAKLFDEFVATAKAQKNDDALKLLTIVNKQDLYVQDYSYFRKAIGLDDDEEIHSIKDAGFLHRIADWLSKDARNDDAEKFLTAPVCLFHLEETGSLHPLAVVIDYKGSMSNSVVLFNKRLTSSDKPANYDEETDWPWRYAKTIVQTADWTRHEVTVHLTNAHFIEEATIVAAQRSFETEHPVYALLQPHWFKTLSLNASARSILVPGVITQIAGMQEESIYDFIKHAYKEFDWTANFVPNDLERRGFPVAEVSKEDGKYKKYMYARDMLDMWNGLRKFVDSMLRISYTSDAEVQRDASVQHWAAEMRNSETGADLQSFPKAFNTIDELVDSVTMCIHIAAPQHTAVNYLQDYYQSFVANRPPCLSQPPPKTLKDLVAYQQSHIMKTIPVNAPRVWLLASHLPFLLSFKVAGDQNLVTYATSLQKLAVGRKNESASDAAASAAASAVADAAGNLVADLLKMGMTFGLRSQLLVNEGLEHYDVLDPVLTANSILI